ncbi:MAG TPA: hypothetical protein VE486_02755 [Candidatus Baltobacteraceae bacterium]|jgi:hypothetical protein|nr:hypothetical protein [Candidatus Baltobacteraceae bacterium]
MNRKSYARHALAAFCAAALTLTAPAFAGFNADAPNAIRRIFTQLALDDGRLVSYHVLEPGPAGVEAFPTGSSTGKLFRFPSCPNLRPVLDDSAQPSHTNQIVLDNAMREVFNVTLSGCDIQPTSASDVLRTARSMQSIGFVNAPSVPAPIGAPVPSNEQQSDDELWGPVPNIGVVDVFAGGNLSPQHIQGTTLSGLPIANVQQPDIRRPRISAYAAGQVVYFITYETKNLSRSGLVPRAVENQWSGSGFPGERDLFFCAYGRAPLPPNAALPAGSLDSNGVPNDNQAVLNIVKGAPFRNVGDYSPLWKMHCVNGDISPAIGPGFPCGSTRFYQIGQPHSLDELTATGIRIEGGIFRDINCPILATDVNDDGNFANTRASKEVVQFADVAW